MSDNRERAVSRALAIASVKRRERANRQIRAWQRYGERKMCGKSAPMRDGTWLVCVLPAGHEYGCKSGDDPPCIFDPK